VDRQALAKIFSIYVKLVWLKQELLIKA